VNQHVPLAAEAAIELSSGLPPPPAPPRRSRRRWWLGGAALVLVAGLSATAGYAYLGAGAAPQFRTEKVIVGPVERKVSAVGALQPRDYVDVGVQVSGQLKVLNVKIGDVVKAGDLLAETDPTVHQTAVVSNRAKLAELASQKTQIQAELQLARAQLGRKQSLAAKNISTQDELDIASSTVAIAEAKLKVVDAQTEQASSALKAAEANLSYTKIYAPMAGTVVSQSAVKGQTLNANQSAPIIVRVADLKTMTVEAKVVEADVVSLKPGMRAYFSTLGMPDRRWEGTVRQILPTPEIINDVVLYKVLVDVPNDDGVLLPSMSAQVSFIEGGVENVPTVPLAALRNGRNGERTARVVTPSGVETREVEVGFTNRTHAEVKSGLVAGDEVVTGMVGAEALQRSKARGLIPGGGPRR
jgi:macrolide-specific efflux system membrane fusion protein